MFYKCKKIKQKETGLLVQNNKYNSDWSSFLNLMI